MKDFHCFEPTAILTRDKHVMYMLE